MNGFGSNGFGMKGFGSNGFGYQGGEKSGGHGCDGGGKQPYATVVLKLVKSGSLVPVTAQAFASIEVINSNISLTFCLNFLNDITAISTMHGYL